MTNSISMKRACVTFAACAAWICVAVPVAFSQGPSVVAQDISGYWVLHVLNADGSVFDTYFRLEQTGTTLSGAMLGRGPNGLPIAGTFQDGKLHFATVPPAAPANGAVPAFRFRAQEFDGVFQDGKLALDTQSRQATVHGIAERTTQDAAMPLPLPLPALRDLPDNGLVRTPPMGWNSWNKFAGAITDADVRGMADAMVSSGMSKLGYVYINIDDTWEAGRDGAGNLLPNKKFPDMKALADYVHSKGLKIGIYSSPGPKTCAGYTASFGHEAQDAKTFAAWGIDYLKYDLCSARGIYANDAATLQGIYQKMGEALQSSGRPIVYSLCEYGNGDVWKWGAKAGGNLWRTTGDISDHWQSMDRIGFSQLDIANYSKPGHWNDPDMLEIGNGGMTADEYRTHMSLWSMLSAPLIAGNDLRSMSDETKSILMNAEVIAIDQDTAGNPAQLLRQDGKVEVLTKQLQDGSVAVGIYNRGDAPAQASLEWNSLKLNGRLQAHDLWAHTAVPVDGTYTAQVPAHGVVLLQVSSSRR